MELKQKKNTIWLELFLLTIISALVYLPKIDKLSFHSDDWYFLYNALVLGSKSFIDLSLHTRPIRGPLYQLLFSLFGFTPLYYNLALYFFRLLSGWGAYWLFLILWPKQKQANFFMAALFLIYPGFLWWVSGFEFQPYVLSLTLQVFSIVFTLKAVKSPNYINRIVWTIGAILTGWIYLALVEYSIGMEIFRVLSVLLIIKHDKIDIKLRELFLRTFRASAAFLIIPIGFFYWYQFIFENWRKAQQASSQLGRVISNPLTVVTWGLRLFQSLLNEIFLTWVIPFNSNFYNGKPFDFVFRFFMMAVVIIIGILAFNIVINNKNEEYYNFFGEKIGWQFELLWLGLLGTIGGILPIVLANRMVSTTINYSQYGLPASLTSVLFLGGLIYSIKTKILKIFALSIMIGLASLTHQAISYRAATEERSIYRFWWQISWRAPSIRSKTSLMAQYPFDVGDNGSIIWGPANFIYYPDEQNQSWVDLSLSAITRQPETLKNIMTSKKIDELNLIITNTNFHHDYGNMLVLVQPGDDVCVRVIDAAWSEYSTTDDPMTFVSGPYSKIENIVAYGQTPVPPKLLFGTEPAHSWCYYYQKAELARQQENWPEIARLGKQAEQLGFHPNDAIEWMPFLQAYAYLGDEKALEKTAKFVKSEPYYQKQTCKNLIKMNSVKHPLLPNILYDVNRLFCKG